MKVSEGCDNCYAETFAEQVAQGSLSSGWKEGCAVIVDAAVEVGIAAFCAGEEPPSDEEVWGRLTGAGVEPWLAERLLIFLPMAYTRRLLPDVQYPDGLVVPAGR
jgi:hypothetical protein